MSCHGLDEGLSITTFLKGSKHVEEKNLVGSNSGIGVSEHQYDGGGK